MSGPPSRRGFVARSESAWKLEGVGGGKAESGGAPLRCPWDGEESFGAELRAFGTWVAPRRLEESLEAEAVGRVVEAAREAGAGRARKTKVPERSRIAGDAAVVEIDKVTEALTRVLEAQPWVFKVWTTAGEVVVEDANGARTAVVEARPSNSDGEASLGDREVRWLVMAARAAGAKAPSDWREAVSALEAAAQTRNALPCFEANEPDSKRTSRLRRGDEASLELCAAPLYPDRRGVLVGGRYPGQALADDQECLSLASCCRLWGPSELPASLDSAAAGAVRRFVEKALEARRGGTVTCAQLRTEAKLGTFDAGNYVDDDGRFKPLDRPMVELFKRKLRAGADPDALRKNDNTETTLSKTHASNQSTSSTALALVGDASSEPAPKRQRGGAILKLVRDSRPPPRADGPPPPRTVEEQLRAAAVECAELEIAREDKAARDTQGPGERPTSSKKGALLTVALPASALAEMRARQLLRSVLCFAAAPRSADLVQDGVLSSPYAVTLRRVDPRPFDEAASLSTPVLSSSLKKSGSDGRPPNLRRLAPKAADLKSVADVELRTGDVDAAVASYTSALAADPDHPVLLVDRSKALLVAGLSRSAASDAARAVSLAPSWFAALDRLAVAFRTLAEPDALDALLEYVRIVDPVQHARLLEIRKSDLRDLKDAASEFRAQPKPTPDLVFRTFDDAKAAGDAAFKSKRHADALTAYSAAVRVASRERHDPTPQARRKLAAAFSNRAAASTALSAHVDALHDGIAAAALAPDWVKGHVRVATALRALHRHHDAIQAYFNALTILPGDLDLNAGLCDAVEAHQLQQQHSAAPTSGS